MRPPAEAPEPTVIPVDIPEEEQLVELPIIEFCFITRHFSSFFLNSGVKLSSKIFSDTRLLDVVLERILVEDGNIEPEADFSVDLVTFTKLLARK